MKYGRSGEPHARRVYLSNDLKNIAWCDIKSGKRQSKDSYIRVSDITDLKQGRTTDVFKSQQSAAARYFSGPHQRRWDEERSFSFVCGSSRTLDLEADSKLEAEAFLREIRSLLIENGCISEVTWSKFQIASSGFSEGDEIPVHQDGVHQSGGVCCSA